MKAFQRKLEEDLQHLQNLQEIYSHKEGWIVESEHHVNVGERNGLNGTAFAVKSPMSCRYAQVWNTQQEAEKQGADYYLVDGNNKPIYMIFTKAHDFYTREIENTKELLVFLKSKI
ncbi:MAG: hypothetical protein ACI4TD_02980 [Phocaeicola sp.]